MCNIHNLSAVRVGLTGIGQAYRTKENPAWGTLLILLAFEKGSLVFQTKPSSQSNPGSSRLIQCTTHHVEVKTPACHGSSKIMYLTNIFYSDYISIENDVTIKKVHE
jgi:hypothetical protein